MKHFRIILDSSFGVPSRKELRSREEFLREVDDYIRVFFEIFLSVAASEVIYLVSLSS